MMKIDVKAGRNSSFTDRPSTERERHCVHDGTADSDPPKVGLSEREMYKRTETVACTLARAKQALARGDYSFLQWEIDELLKVFRINLDPNSASYRELGLAMLRAFVKSIEALQEMPLRRRVSF